MSDAWDQIDPYIEAFERVRAQGPVADLSPFAPPPDHPLHGDVLKELIRVDLELGWAEGRRTALAEYRRSHPTLFADIETSRDIARDELRLRREHGEEPDSAEYEAYGLSARDCAVAMSAPHRATPANAESDASSINLELSDLSASQRPKTVGVLPAGSDGQTSDLRKRLQSRLRYIAVGCTAVMVYFSLLVLFNPSQKVAFSLDRWFPMTVHWLACLVCVGLTVVLWRFPGLSLRQLRGVELALFGIITAEMGADFFHDLFIDRELREPFTQGNHALFHYATSWSLPFFAIIVCYGTLVPSTWRRCIAVVAAIALLPLALGVAASMSEIALGKVYVQSFLLPMAIWMGAGAAIAVYGASRLEELRLEIVEARRLGQYHLKKSLGSGGMGDVYLAEHMLLRRPCAIKLIRPDLARDPAAIRRFEHEVQVTATLTHPNTVQVFDYGHTNDGTFYYVMEYLPGPNLDQIVRNHGPMSIGRAVQVARQLCGALAEAHAAGLVHRDLKPSNVILCERGGVHDVAKLLDFGLALGSAAARLSETRTQFGTVAGSPLYMSPEQAAGRDIVDCRADVYSLGALLYFLVIGQPPFVRHSVSQTLAAHIEEAVTIPDQFRPDISPRLQAIILRCMEKDPSKRFQTVQELDLALSQVS